MKLDAKRLIFILKCTLKFSLKSCLFSKQSEQSCISFSLVLCSSFLRGTDQTGRFPLETTYLETLGNQSYLSRGSPVHVIYRRNCEHGCFISASRRSSLLDRGGNKCVNARVRVIYAPIRSVLSILHNAHVIAELCTIYWGVLGHVY